MEPRSMRTHCVVAGLAALAACINPGAILPDAGAPPRDGGADAGAGDAGMPDAATPDPKERDAGRDAGAPSDAGGADAGAGDAGMPDAAAPDPEERDAGRDAGAPSDAGGADAGAGDAGYPLPPLPLHTQGRWIVDATNQRFKLASVSWYGAESPDHVVGGLDRNGLDAIAKQIRALGFNSVRLPWSNEMVESNPTVDAKLLAASPALRGLRALEILDRVIDALAREGLVVVLDNHVSRADWCCSDSDGNGLWYTSDYPESAWLRDWELMAQRYRGTPAVVGAELRNELRVANQVRPTWGTGSAQTDWKAAAERGAKAVLKQNPNLLIMVQGLSYSADFEAVYTAPVQLSVPNRLVYAPHDYAWFHSGSEAFDALDKALGNRWGFILVQGKSFTAPVWVSEFGTCNTSTSCLADTSGGGLWFQSFTRYLANADIDWAYWSINGTQSTGYSRNFGDPETYGVLDTGWSRAGSGDLLKRLQALQPASQGP